MNAQQRRRAMETNARRRKAVVPPWRMIPASQLERGMILDDERFRFVMDIGHVRIGSKWVTAWSFHPDARVYPNTPYKLRVTELVRIAA
jgi:hypothetical protein